MDINLVKYLQEVKINEDKDIFWKYPPGTYYIGDPCYIMSDIDYDKMGETNDWELSGVFDINGSKVAVDHTAYGDGSYHGSDGTEFGVDAGIIGIVPEVLFDKEKKRGWLGGKIVKASQDLVFHAKDGLFTIAIDHKKDLVINTIGDKNWNTDESRIEEVEPSKPSTGKHYWEEFEGWDKAGNCLKCGEAGRCHCDHKRKNESRIEEVSPKMKNWRNNQKKGAIMKPSTFKKIEKKAKESGATNPEKVAGAAYWQTVKDKFKNRKK